MLSYDKLLQINLERKEYVDPANSSRPVMYLTHCMFFFSCSAYTNTHGDHDSNFHIDAISERNESVDKHLNSIIPAHCYCVALSRYCSEPQAF